MAVFRLFLILFLIALAIYTALVVRDHGANLVSPFFGDMAELGWPGQFNLDFMGFLMLSGLWVAWRHGFSALGLALGAVALVGGMMFLTVYLLIVTGQAKGDVEELLLGRKRARVGAAS